MSSDTRGVAADNGRPTRGAPVIRATALQADSASRDWRRLIPAWIVSGVVHAVLLSLLLLVTFKSAESADDAPKEKQVLEPPSDMVDTQDLNLTNEELGTNPDIDTNYNNTRIEEYS